MTPHRPFPSSLHRYLAPCICLVGWLMLSSCATLNKPEPILEDEVAPGALLHEEIEGSSATALPNETLESTENTRIEDNAKRYTLTFQDAPLANVIDALAKETEMNILVESSIDLTKKVTVHLKNIPFEKALDLVVMGGAGYAWRVNGNDIHITRFKEYIYHLDYLDIPTSTEIEIGGDMLASSVESAGVAGLFTVASSKKAEDSGVWIGVSNALKGMKSKEGNLFIDPNVGMIYMSDTPQHIDSMVRYLDTLKEALHREVFLEAKILEVQLTENNQYGIDWSSLEINFLSELAALPDQFSVSFNGGSSALLSGESRVQALVNFLQTQGDVSLISNPHLSVMNGQTAVMTVGYQFPFSDIQGVDRDPETGITTFVTSIKRAVLGLQMGISAQISQDGIVNLHLVPTITRIQREIAVEIPTTSNRTQAISNPVIDLQEMATSVRVREGQSVVIGGLISREEKLDGSGLPFLHRIPILGLLFGHRGEARESRELVMVITPHIKYVR